MSNIADLRKIRDVRALNHAHKIMETLGATDAREVVDMAEALLRAERAVEVLYKRSNEAHRAGEHPSAIRAYADAANTVKSYIEGWGQE